MDVALVSIMTRSILLPLVHMSFALYMGYAFGKSTYMRWDMIDARKIRKLRYLFKDRRKKWRFTTLKALFIIVGIILA